MAVLALLVVVLVLVAIALLRTRRADAFRTMPVSAQAASALRSAARATRLRSVASITVGVVVFVIFFAVNEAQPGAYGLPLLLAPGMAASASLLVFGAIRPARLDAEPTASRRSASLSSRRPWSFGPPWAYLLPLVAAVSAVVFTVVAGVRSTATDDGTYRAIRVSLGDATSTASPYPGWYYGVPLLAMTALLAAATAFALGRIASAPAPGVDSLTEADRILRVASARVVMKLSSGALFSYFGGVLFFAGQATRNAGTFWTGASSTVVQPEGALGTTEMIAGGVALVLGATLLVLSALDAARAPVTVVVTQEPAAGAHTGRTA